ncbi:hypothetical protein FIBSPDRAFT_902933 [Athelia psychrophila]|uniref:Uncharacterized protein n=1 Tax=Athelia psychrophila TaxID=1759441 RepID=A0A167WLS3_9AGAM|nr:hypothetical protein FIBSPDRAFT_902933 [Fibularhizoctonia sp. CBS 109695]
MDAGIRACNAAHMGVDVGFVEPLRLRLSMPVRQWDRAGMHDSCTLGERIVHVSGNNCFFEHSLTGACGAPTQRDSRECGRVCKEFLTGKGSRTVDWDGTVAAGVSVRVLARHWQGVRHRRDELARTVRLCWECKLNELARGIPGGLCVFCVPHMSPDGRARIRVVCCGHRLSVTMVETSAGARWECWASFGAMLGKWDCERGGWSAQGAESHPVAALIRAASTGTAREACECLLGFRSERARGAARHKRLERGGGATRQGSHESLI